MTRHDPDRIPVIIGVGEVMERPVDPAQGREPLALMADALAAADGDAGGGWLGRFDSLDIVNQVSWRYDSVAARLCARLGIAPARAVYGLVGGETPVKYLHAAAARIAAGESAVAAVTGAEAQRTVNAARKAGVALPWTLQAKAAENPIDIAGLVNPLALRHMAVQPMHVYPFYESAWTARRGQTPAEGHALSARVWAGMAAVAAGNPYAWSRQAFTADAIATPAPENRLVGGPYTKRMVANPAVNQGAAVIVASLAAARAAGVPEDRMIFIRGGAAADAPRDWLARAAYDRSPAQEAVLKRAVEIARGVPDALELYSCFPVVPKMALEALVVPFDTPCTVAGGLSFFGAPLNGYMTHAAAAMVRRLRADGGTGLLYGQGEYVTKHHALVLSSERPGLEPGSADPVPLAEAGVPPLSEDHEGPVTVEAHSMMYDRDGAPATGLVIGRTPSGGRVLAAVRDPDSIARLMDPDVSAVGAAGTCRTGKAGLLDWTA